MRPLPTLLAAVLVAPLAACGADPGAIDVSVTGPDDVTLSAASRLTLSIYGYDTRIADQSATLIRTRVEPITALPVVVSVALPDDALARVDPTVGGDLAANVRFYLAGVYVDVDGDGAICPGELTQDFGPDGPLVFGVDGPGGPLAIPMTVLGDPGCVDPFPDGQRP